MDEISVWEKRAVNQPTDFFPCETWQEKQPWFSVNLLWALVRGPGFVPKKLYSILLKIQETAMRATMVPKDSRTR